MQKLLPSLRAETAVSAAYNFGGDHLLKRTLVAIPALGLLFLVVYFHGLYFKIFAGIMAILCTHEMMKVTSMGGAQPIKWIGYAFAALIYPVYDFAGGFSGIAILTALALICIFTVLILTGRDTKDGFMTAFCLFYPGTLLVFLTAVACIPQKSASQFMIILAFGAAIITDTFAYFTGNLLGKHKLAQSISPKKTIEGSIGGTVFGTGAVFLTGYFAQAAFGININPLWYLLLGFVLSILTQLGDLSASLIKRKFGAKDYGRIMAGHGGAMDRLDSVLFISPAVYIFYLIISL